MRIVALRAALFLLLCSAATAQGPLRIQTNSPLPAATVGTPYSFDLQGMGGTPPYAWSIVSGALPQGLSLDGLTGRIAGTPTTMGTAAFGVRLGDSVGGAEVKQFELSVIPPPLSITTASPLPAGGVGVPYSQTLSATGGVAPYTWSVISGSLPNGLSLNATTGAITGTPTAAGAASFTVQARDAASATASAVFSLTIAPAPLSITSTSPLPTGSVGAPYSQTLTAAGGVTPYTWSVTAGSLPGGLSLNATTGAITGTPTAAGAASFTVQVRDAASTTASAAFSLTINAPPLSITSTSPLPTGSVGVPYSQTLTATGGVTPYMWSVTAGSLPGGLSLNPTTGAITGTPTAAGATSFTVQVRDAASTTASAAFSLTIAPPPLSITSTSPLPAGGVGVPYSQTLTAIGGVTPYTWSVTSGSLPGGLSLNPSTGAITGTPTAAGTASFTVQVADAASATASAAFSLTIAPPALSISSTSPLPAGSVGVQYSQTLTATGGVTPYTWLVISGSLPNGLSLNATTGAITGTPTAAGAAGFTVQVRDAASTTANAAFSLTIAPPPLSITSTSPLPTGGVGVPYSQTLTATGGVTPYTWLVTSGSLPGGLSLNPSTGAITGTPTAAGTANLTVQVTDAASATASAAFSLTIAPPALSISSTSPLPAGSVGVQYSQTLTATGGVTPYTWSVTSGSLPGGLSLNATTGAITGTPTAAGTASFTVQVRDAASTTASAAFSVTVNPPALSISSTSPLPAGSVGVAYNQSLSVTGGVAPYTWSVTSGSLPSGLSLNPSTGAISGTPTAAGTANFTVQVADAASATASAAFSLTIAPPALSISSTSPLPPAAVGAPYSQTLAATGGVTPYTWSVSSGSLPGGLSLNPSTGAISGTPTAAGTANFTVQVADAASATASAAFGLTVNPPALSISSTSPLPPGTVGAPYSQTLTATGGVAPYTWSVTAGSLPGGLSLNPSTGAITGTPTTAGTANFTVQVADAASATASAAFGLTVNPPALSISSTSPLPPGTVGAPYSQTLTATGGLTPYTWSVTAGSLPGGLSLNATTGAITGTPTAAGTANFTVQVRDAASVTASAAFTLPINPAQLVITTACPLPSGPSGSAYATTIAASGGVAPYSWAITSGSLPPGLSLAGDGRISGTPSTSGAYQFTIGVTDAASSTASKTCSLVIGAALSITTSTLADGVLGSPYSQTLTASGGQPPYTWSLAAGNLPPGISLNAGTGAISGQPAAAGTFTFTARVTDTAGASAERALTIRINSTLAIPSCPSAAAVVGRPYSATVAATGGRAPYRWSIASGALPGGLTLDAASGVIAGSPGQAGAATFTLSITDADTVAASRACSITVSAAPITLSITTAALAEATVSANYSHAFTATGGSPPYTWSLTSGTLPAGITLAPSGQLAGAPTQSGTFNFQVQVADSASATAVRAFALVVLPALTVQSCPAATAMRGRAYSSSAVATGGKAPYTWSVPAEQLPPGLSFNASSAQLSGSPLNAGRFDFTIYVVDANRITANRACSLTVASELTLVTLSVADATMRAIYLQALTAQGGSPPYSWSTSAGSLPPGITLDVRSGVLTGTPTQPGTFTFTVRVTDNAGGVAERNYSINVAAGLIVPSCPAPSGAMRQSYSATLAAVGGELPYTWSLSAGALPGGLTLQPNPGLIAGMPSAPGPFTFTLSARDRTGSSATRDCTITIAEELAISATSLPEAAVGATYGRTLAASGGVPPYAWSIVAGAAPPGITLNAATGAVAGVPAAAGPFRFTARVSDAAGVSAEREFTLVVSAAFAITDCPAPTGVAGQPYSSALNATGGRSPFTWRVSNGELPPGVALDASNGVIAGTPGVRGSFAFTLGLADSTGAATSRACTILIAASGVTILTTETLPDAAVGVQYSTALAAAGGTPPYQWSAVGGELPAGLRLSLAGMLEGTPSAPGTYTLVLRVADADGQTSARTFSITVAVAPTPEVELTGLSAILPPAQQPPIGLSLRSAYPLPIRGLLRLRFVPDPGIDTDDPAVQFSTGGREVEFTVPAAATTPVFPVEALALQTGTTAGSIEFSIELQSGGRQLALRAPVLGSVRIDRQAPRATELRLERTAGGFQARITGFSTTRQLGDAVFRFTASTGHQLQVTEISIPLSEGSAAWYRSSESVRFGTQFTLVQPFSIEGTVDAIASVSVTLSNAQGTSPAVRAQF